MIACAGGWGELPSNGIFVSADHAIAGTVPAADGYRAAVGLSDARQRPGLTWANERAPQEEAVAAEANVQGR